MSRMRVNVVASPRRLLAVRAPRCIKFSPPSDGFSQLWVVSLRDQPQRPVRGRRPEGWTRDKVMAKIGSQVTVTGRLARAGGNAAHSRQLTFADGSKMESGPGAGNGGPPAN